MKNDLKNDLKKEIDLAFGRMKPIPGMVTTPQRGIANFVDRNAVNDKVKKIIIEAIKYARKNKRS